MAAWDDYQYYDDGSDQSDSGDQNQDQQPADTGDEGTGGSSEPPPPWDTAEPISPDEPIFYDQGQGQAQQDQRPAEQPTSGQNFDVFDLLYGPDTRDISSPVYRPPKQPADPFDLLYGDQGGQEYATRDEPPLPSPNEPTPAALPNTWVDGRPMSEEEQRLARVYKTARENGLNEEGARAMVAEAKTEGGLFGAPGDGGTSFGPWQLHIGGQFDNFQQWLKANGIPGDPRELAKDIELATTFAAQTYQGNTIRAAQAQGVHGAELATYAQQHGQVSINPWKAGQNYDSIFKDGDPYAAVLAAAVPDAGARVARTAQLPPGHYPGDGHEHAPATPYSENAVSADGNLWTVAFDYLAPYNHPFNPAIPVHRGVDLQITGAPTSGPHEGGRGTQYTAFQDGVVVAITHDPDGGTGIITQDPTTGLYSRYFHNDDVLVKQGDQVEAGKTKLGVLGASGTEGFPHLHFEVSKGINGDPIGQTIDPRPYMSPAVHQANIPPSAQTPRPATAAPSSPVNTSPVTAMSQAPPQPVPSPAGREQPAPVTAKDMNLDEGTFSQLQTWQALRKQRGEDPTDLPAFRQHLQGIGAADPWAEQRQQAQPAQRQGAPVQTASYTIEGREVSKPEYDAAVSRNEQIQAANAEIDRQNAERKTAYLADLGLSPDASPDSISQAIEDRWAVGDRQAGMAEAAHIQGQQAVAVRYGVTKPYETVSTPQGVVTRPTQELQDVIAHRQAQQDTNDLSQSGLFEQSQAAAAEQRVGASILDAHRQADLQQTDTAGLSPGPQIMPAKPEHINQQVKDYYLARGYSEEDATKEATIPGFEGRMAPPVPLRLATEAETVADQQARIRAEQAGQTIAQRVSAANRGDIPDDRSTLGRLRDALDSGILGVAQSVLSDTPQFLAGTMRQIDEHISSLPLVGAGAAATPQAQTARVQGAMLDRFGQWMGNYLENQAAILQREGQDIVRPPDRPLNYRFTGDLPVTLAEIAIQGAPSLAIGIASAAIPEIAAARLGASAATAARIGYGASFLSMYGMEGSQAYMEARRQGADEATAVGLGNLVGVINAAIENAPVMEGVSTVLGELGARRVTSALSDQLGKAAATEVAQRGATTPIGRGAVALGRAIMHQAPEAVGEGLEEVLQGATQNLAQAVYDPNSDLSQGLLDSFVGGFLPAIIMGSTQGALARGHARIAGAQATQGQGGPTVADVTMQEGVTIRPITNDWSTFMVEIRDRNLNGGSPYMIATVGDRGEVHLTDRLPAQIDVPRMDNAEQRDLGVRNVGALFTFLNQNGALSDEARRSATDIFVRAANDGVRLSTDGAQRAYRASEGLKIDPNMPMEGVNEGPYAVPAPASWSAPTQVPNSPLVFRARGGTSQEAIDKFVNQRGLQVAATALSNLEEGTTRSLQQAGVLPGGRSRQLGLIAYGGNVRAFNHATNERNAAGISTKALAPISVDIGQILDDSVREAEQHGVDWKTDPRFAVRWANLLATSVSHEIAHDLVIEHGASHDAATQAFGDAVTTQRNALIPTIHQLQQDGAIEPLWHAHLEMMAQASPNPNWSRYAQRALVAGSSRNADTALRQAGGGSGGLGQAGLASTGRAGSGSAAVLPGLGANAGGGPQVDLGPPTAGASWRSDVSQGGEHPALVAARERASRRGVARIRDDANAYVNAAGIRPAIPTTAYVANDPLTQRRIADYYDRTPSTENDPQVRASYDQMSKEVDAQYNFLTNRGVRFVPYYEKGPAGDGADFNGYASSQDMVRDLERNNRLYVFADYLDHPNLSPPGTHYTESPNWRFRAVHDYFGHATIGNEFGPRGEENAWLEHVKMFSPLAAQAMTTETRGQNSWVNFRPGAEDIPLKDRPFADQKSLLLPGWAMSRPDAFPEQTQARIATSANDARAADGSISLPVEGTRQQAEYAAAVMGRDQGLPEVVVAHLSPTGNTATAVLAIPDQQFGQVLSNTLTSEGYHVSMRDVPDTAESELFVVARGMLPQEAMARLTLVANALQQSGMGSEPTYYLADVATLTGADYANVIARGPGQGDQAPAPATPQSGRVGTGTGAPGSNTSGPGEAGQRDLSTPAAPGAPAEAVAPPEGTYKVVNGRLVHIPAPMLGDQAPPPIIRQANVTPSPYDVRDPRQGPELPSEAVVPGRAGAVILDPESGHVQRREALGPPLLSNEEAIRQGWVGIPQPAAERITSGRELYERLQATPFIGQDDLMHLLGDRPQDADQVVQFMLDQRAKVIEGRLEPADVAKAYFLTVSSQGQGAINADIVRDKTGLAIPEHFLTVNEQGVRQIRPEDAAAAWLASPTGQRALEAINNGQFDEEAWTQGAAVRAAFSDDRLGSLNVLGLRDVRPGQLTMRDIPQLAQQLNGIGANPEAIETAVSQLNGIGPRKVGFMKHLLGFGETPTIDARAVNVWLTGQGDIRGLTTQEAQIARAINQHLGAAGPAGALVMARIMAGYQGLQQRGFAADIPAEVYSAILHSWLWARVKDVATIAGPIYGAMAQPVRGAGRVAAGAVRAGERGTPGPRIRNNAPTDAEQLAQDWAELNSYGIQRPEASGADPSSLALDYNTRQFTDLQRAGESPYKIINGRPVHTQGTNYQVVNGRPVHQGQGEYGLIDGRPVHQGDTTGEYTVQDGRPTHGPAAARSTNPGDTNRDPNQAGTEIAQRAMRERTPPPEGYAEPGELSMLTPNQLPNGALYRRYKLGMEDGGYVLPKAKRLLNKIIDAIKPNQRIPPGLRNPEMEAFLDDLARMREGIITGETSPESLVMGALIALGSVKRSGRSYAKTLDALTATMGREKALELVLRTNPDIYHQGPPSAQEKGILMRPEILWGMLAGDTTDPVMMGMMAAIARPDAFPDKAARAAAVEAGVTELYRRIGGRDTEGEPVATAIHGRGEDPQKMLGLERMREGVPQRAGKSWLQSEPDRLAVLVDAARAMAGREGTRFQSIVGKTLTGENLRLAIINELLKKHPSGIGPVKSRFSASMVAFPDYATLDTRMLRDVFGLSPKMVFDTPEYEKMSSKLWSIGSDSKYLYGQQWLPWEFLTGEKTTYNSLVGIYDRMNTFFAKAATLSEERGVPISEVIPELTEQEQRLQVDLADPEQVTARVGLAFRPAAIDPNATGYEATVQALRPGESSVTAIKKAFPQLQKLVDEAGLKFFEKPGIALGGWKEANGTYYLDRTFNMTVEGPKPAVRWLAASMMMALPEEQAVMLAYQGAGANGVDHLGGFHINDVHPNDIPTLTQALSDSLPEGWSVYPTSRKIKGQLRFDVDVVSGAKTGTPNGDLSTLSGNLRTVANVLMGRGYTVEVDPIESAELEFIERPAVEEIVRGGPQGAVISRGGVEAGVGESDPSDTGGIGAVGAGGGGTEQAPGLPTAAWDDSSGRGQGPLAQRSTTPDDPLVPEELRAAVPQVADPFYSALQQTLAAKMPNRASPEQIQGLLRGAVKPDELEWTTFDTFLADHAGKPVTKQEALDFARENAVQVKEVMYGIPNPGPDGLPQGWTLRQEGEGAGWNGSVWVVRNEGGNTVSVDVVRNAALASGKASALAEGTPTRYGSYTLPEGQNYRELLLTLPPNRSKDAVMAEMRANMRLTTARTAVTDARRDYRVDVELYGRDSEEAQAQRLIVDRMDRESKEAQQAYNAALAARRKTYSSSHWSEPNVVAHVRFNEREDENGRPVLFIEEVQSDWHQEGRKHGYHGGEQITTLPDGYRPVSRRVQGQEWWRVEGPGTDARGLPEAVVRHLSETPEEATAEALRRLNSQQDTSKLVPRAPFQKTWPELTVKRMIRWAAEHGFSGLSWTTGAQQNERYDLGRTVSRLSYDPESRYLTAGVRGGGTRNFDDVGPEDLATHVGEDVAQSLLAQPLRNGRHTLAIEEGMRLGGAGMEGFYDKILPNVANKLGKKFGAQVTQGRIRGNQLALGKGEALYDILDQHGDPIMQGLTMPAASEYVVRARDQGTWATDHPNTRTPTQVVPSNTNNTVEVHTLPITPAMAQSVMQQGQPLFQLGTTPEDDSDPYTEIDPELLDAMDDIMAGWEVDDPAGSVRTSEPAEVVPLLTQPDDELEALRRGQVAAREKLARERAAKAAPTAPAAGPPSIGPPMGPEDPRTPEQRATDELRAYNQEADARDAASAAPTAPTPTAPRAPEDDAVDLTKFPEWARSTIDLGQGMKGLPEGMLQRSVNDIQDAITGGPNASLLTPAEVDALRGAIVMQYQRAVRAARAAPSGSTDQAALAAARAIDESVKYATLMSLATVPQSAWATRTGSGLEQVWNAGPTARGREQSLPELLKAARTAPTATGRAQANAAVLRRAEEAISGTPTRMRAPTGRARNQRIVDAAQAVKEVATSPDVTPKVFATALDGARDMNIGFVEAILSSRYNAMLFGARGILVDYASNTGQFLYKLATDPFMPDQGGLDLRARAAITGREYAAVAGHFPLMASRVANTLLEGIEDAQAEQTGVPHSMSGRLTERIKDAQARRDAAKAGMGAAPDRLELPLLHLKKAAAIGLGEAAGRLKAIADVGVRTLGYGAEHVRQAAVMATNEGKFTPGSKQWHDRVDQIARGEGIDQTVYERMSQNSLREAQRYTFQGPMGTVGRALEVVQRNPAGQFILPFLRALYHIRGWAIDLSPLGAAVTLGDVARSYIPGAASHLPGGSRFLDATRNLGGLAGGPYQYTFKNDPESNAAVGPGVADLDRRAMANAIGTAAFFWMLGSAFAGGISGSGPPDDPIFFLEDSEARPDAKAIALKNTMMAAGWRPYSIKLGSTWYSYSNWGPLAYLLAASAAIAETYKYGMPPGTVRVTSDDPFSSTKLRQMAEQGDARTVQSAGRRFFGVTKDMSYLGGFMDLYGLAQNVYALNIGGGPPGELPTDKIYRERREKAEINRYLGNIATSFIPVGALANTIAQSQDPYERATEFGDIKQQFAYHIPDEGPVPSLGPPGNYLPQLLAQPVTGSNNGRRSGLPVAVDVIGRDRRNQYEGLGAINPFRNSAEDLSSPTLNALIEAGIGLPNPPAELVYTPPGPKGGPEKVAPVMVLIPTAMRQEMGRKAGKQIDQQVQEMLAGDWPEDHRKSDPDGFRDAVGTMVKEVYKQIKKDEMANTSIVENIIKPLSQDSNRTRPVPPFPTTPKPTDAIHDEETPAADTTPTGPPSLGSPIPAATPSSTPRSRTSATSTPSTNTRTTPTPAPAATPRPTPPPAAPGQKSQAEIDRENILNRLKTPVPSR